MLGRKQKRLKKKICPVGLLRLLETMATKCLVSCLAHGRYLINGNYHYCDHDHHHGLCGA